MRWKIEFIASHPREEVQDVLTSSMAGSSHPTVIRISLSYLLLTLPTPRAGFVSGASQVDPDGTCSSKVAAKGRSSFSLATGHVPIPQPGTEARGRHSLVPEPLPACKVTKGSCEGGKKVLQKSGISFPGGVAPDTRCSLLAVSIQTARFKF